MVMLVLAMLHISMVQTAKSDNDNMETYVESSDNRAGIYPIIESERYGFINDEGEVVIKPKYRGQTEWDDGVIINGNIAYDYSGKPIDALLNYDVAVKWGDVYICRENDGWIFVSYNGKKITEYTYRDYRLSKCGKKAIVRRTEKEKEYILIDIGTGQQQKIDTPYYIQAYGDNKILVTLTDREDWYKCLWSCDVPYAIYDISGHPIIGFEQGMKWNKQYAPYEWNRPESWIDSEGMILFRDPYTSKYGYYNDKGEKEIEPQYKYSYPFMEGRAVVAISDDSFGTIDVNGTVITPIMYDKIKSYSSGMAAINIDGRWGYIDRMGNVVIKAEYDYAGYFDGNISYVERDGKAYYINKRGQIIWEHNEPDQIRLQKMIVDVHTYDYVTTMKVKW